MDCTPDERPVMARNHRQGGPAAREENGSQGRPLPFPEPTFVCFPPQGAVGAGWLLRGPCAKWHRLLLPFRHWGTHWLPPGHVLRGPQNSCRFWEREGKGVPENASVYGAHARSLCCSLRNQQLLPWPGGLVGWAIVLCTKRLQVRFPVRAHTYVAGLIPGRGMYRRRLIDVSVSLSLTSISIYSDEDFLKTEHKPCFLTCSKF